MRISQKFRIEAGNRRQVLVHWLMIAAAFIVLTQLSNPSYSNVVLEPIVIQGQAAPDGGLIISLAPTNFAFVPNGEIVFHAGVEPAPLTPAQARLYRGRPQEFQTLLASGDPVPGHPDKVIERFSLLPATTGSNSIISTVIAPADSGILLLTSNGPEALAISGQPVPGASPGVHYLTEGPNALSASPPVGEYVMFNAFLDGAVAPENDQAVLSGKPNDIHIIAQRGFSAPGGNAYQWLNAGAVSPAGRVAFTSSESISNSAPRTLYAGTVGDLRRVVGVGDVDATKPGERFMWVDGGMQYHDDKLLFRATTGTLGPGFALSLYSYDSARDQYRSVLRTGQVLPGMSSQVRLIDELNTNRNGNVALDVKFSDGTSAILGGALASLEPIIVNSVDTPFLSIADHLKINNFGQIAFKAAIRNAPDDETYGIFIAPPEGPVIKILQTGDRLSGPGYFGTVTEDLSLVDFNDAGELIIIADLDHQQGVAFLVRPPPLKHQLDGALILDSESIENLRSRIVAGRNAPPGGVASGQWNGSVGISSNAAAQAFLDNGKEVLSIGYARNGDLPLGPYASFNGHRVDQADLFVRLTRNGDANLDGRVDNNDVTIMAGFYRPSEAGKHWYQADFNYDGIVDNNDITILAGFYNPAASPLSLSLPSSALSQATFSFLTPPIPEPSIIILLVPCLLQFRGWKKRLSLASAS